MVHTARHLFGRSPKDSETLGLTVMAEDIFHKLVDFRKNQKDVYASVEIINTSELEEYPIKYIPHNMMSL